MLLGGQAVLAEVIKGLTAQLRTDHGTILQFFRQCDEATGDDEGGLDMQEFTTALEKMRVAVGPEKMRALFVLLDPDQSGLIDYREFLEGTKFKLQVRFAVRYSAVELGLTTSCHGVCLQATDRASLECLNVIQATNPGPSTLL